MRKSLSKHIASFDYFDKSIIVLSLTSCSISIASFASAIWTPVRKVSAIFSLAFSISAEVMKKLLKTTRNKKKKHKKVVMWARSKLNNIEKKISEALINNEINHEGFKAIINEEKSYRELKEGIRLMNRQRSDGEKINLIEESKTIAINEVIKHNEIINNSLKP